MWSFRDVFTCIRLVLRTLPGNLVELLRWYGALGFGPSIYRRLKKNLTNFPTVVQYWTFIVWPPYTPLIVVHSVRIRASQLTFCALSTYHFVFNCESYLENCVPFWVKQFWFSSMDFLGITTVLRFYMYDVVLLNFRKSDCVQKDRDLPQEYFSAHSVQDSLRTCLA